MFVSLSMLCHTAVQLGQVLTRCFGVESLEVSGFGSLGVSGYGDFGIYVFGPKTFGIKRLGVCVMELKPAGFSVLFSSEHAGATTAHSLHNRTFLYPFLSACGRYA